MLWMAFQTVTPAGVADDRAQRLLARLGPAALELVHPQGWLRMLTEILVRLIEDPRRRRHDQTKWFERLIVENGNAPASNAADGSSYHADKAVLSTIHIKPPDRDGAAAGLGRGFRRCVETWQGGPTLFVQHYATSEPMTFRGDGRRHHAIASRCVGTDRAWDGYDFARGVANVEEPVLLAVSPTIGDPRKHARQAHHQDHRHAAL